MIVVRMPAQKRRPPAGGLLGNYKFTATDSALQVERTGHAVPYTAHSYHPVSCNPVGSRSGPRRGKSGIRSLVVDNRNRSLAVGRSWVVGNIEPWRVLACQARLRQRNQQPRVFSLYALCHEPWPR